MKINKKKTVMVGGKSKKINISIGDKELEQPLEKYEFLGSIITEGFTCTTKIKPE